MINSTHLKLTEFTTLGAGWCYGQGKPFSNDVMRTASSLLTRLIEYGYPKTDVFPGSNGEIMVTAYRGDEYFEFTVNSSQSIDFVFENDDVEVDNFPAQRYSDIELLIKTRTQVNQTKWKLLGHSTPNIGIQINPGSTHLLLSHLVKMEESLFLPVTVPEQPLNQLPNIFGNIIQQQLEPLRFIGQSRANPFLLT